MRKRYKNILLRKKRNNKKNYIVGKLEELESMKKKYCLKTKKIIIKKKRIKKERYEMEQEKVFTMK